MKIKLTDTALRALFPEARAEYIAALTSATASRLFDQHGVSHSSRRMAHFLAQVAAETRGLELAEESGNYSAARLREIFPRYFTPAQARVYARRPKAALSRAYANRMGNGPESSGDGWTYRGRGLLQITGREAYATRGKRIGVDLEAKPELAAEGSTALHLALQYWSDLNLNRWADADDLLACSRGVNCGSPVKRIQPNGMEHRKSWLRDVSAALKADVHVPDPAEDGVLREGEEGEIVREMQNALIALGYGRILGTADGVFGPMTRDAVVLFQSREGLGGEQGVWVMDKFGEALKTAEPVVNEARAGVTAADLASIGHPSVTFTQRLKKLASTVFGGTIVGGLAAQDPSVIGALTALKTTSESVSPILAFAAQHWWWALPAAVALIVWMMSQRQEQAETADYAAMKSTQGA